MYFLSGSYKGNEIMSPIKNEDAVSEVVGAMLILLFIVVFLGILQAYEVPAWNKELENQHFDIVYSDFVALRSDLEDVSIKNVPKTSEVHMGVKYPQRFMLRNPGQGAYGMLTSYPLDINISYATGSGLSWKNYTSTGMVYEMSGSTAHPALVYEHGLIIRDFGNVNFSEDDTLSLITEDNIFIPVIAGSVDTSSSMEEETINSQPIPQSDYTQPRVLSMNATLRTRYPGIWAKLPNDSRPQGSGFRVDVPNSTIEITGVQAYGKRLKLPGSGAGTPGGLYSGMVTVDTSISSTRGPTGPDGQDMWVADLNGQGDGRLDIPTDKSGGVKEFIVRDVVGIGNGAPPCNVNQPCQLKFSVYDARSTIPPWTVTIKFDYLGTDHKIKSIWEFSPGTVNYTYFSGKKLSELGGEINLTSYYKTGAGDIIIPNMLRIEAKDDPIYYVNFLIN